MPPILASHSKKTNRSLFTLWTWRKKFLPNREKLIKWHFLHSTHIEKLVNNNWGIFTKYIKYTFWGVLKILTCKERIWGDMNSILDIKGCCVLFMHNYLYYVMDSFMLFLDMVSLLVLHFPLEVILGGPLMKLCLNED